MSNRDASSDHNMRLRKTASPPKKGGSVPPHTSNQIIIQNAYGNSQNQNAQAQQTQGQTQQQSNQGGGGQGQVAAQANQMIMKRQLTFTQEQLNELSRAGRFGKTPVPQEYAVIPPQASEFRGRKTLVLDLDETLIHSKFSEAHLRACRTRGRCDFQMRIVVEGRPIQVFVLIRPGVLFFLQKLASIYEIVLYTASMSIYANPLVDTLDQDQLIPMRLYREHCFSFQGSYIKDLSLLGREMKDVIIVDNSPNAYHFHNENAVPILSWYDDPDDRCLFEMIPLLEALSQVPDVRQVIPKFVRKDINLVDFPKAAWVLNDAYRKMHATAADKPAAGPGEQTSEPTKNGKKVLSAQKQPSAGTNAQQTPKKQVPGQNPKIDDAYERKPSPINLKPLSPRHTKIGQATEQATEGKSIGQQRKDRTFSPRQQIKISSKQQNESDGNQEDSQEPSKARKSENNTSNNSYQDKQQDGKDEGRRESRGKASATGTLSSTTPGASSGGAGAKQPSPSKEWQEDEVAIDQVQKKSRRKVSHQLRSNESSDLDSGTTGNQSSQQNRSNLRGATQEALDSGLAQESSDNNQLYQKVSQRKQIMQRHLDQQAQIALRRKQSANATNGNAGADSNESGRLSASKQSTSQGQNNSSFSQGRVGNVQLEINTNKAELAAGSPMVDLPPHLQKIMQARSTTNKTSSMARQAIVIPQGNIITPVSGKLVNSHRIGTSNGMGQKDGSNLNSTFQNIPKSNNLFQTSPTEQLSDIQTDNISGKRSAAHTGKTPLHHGTTPTQNTTENLNRSYSNQGQAMNGSLSTAGAIVNNRDNNANQSSTSWASRQQMINMGQSANTTGQASREGSGPLQHSSRLNGRRKLSRNDMAATSNSQAPGGSVPVQGNLSIRRGITRYQQANSHQRPIENGVNGVMSSRNDAQQASHQAGTVKLIGKNSLHMKRRSEYPQDSSNSNQWHLPDAAGSNQGIITSESQKSTAVPGFNFQKHSQQNAPNPAWVQGSAAAAGADQNQNSGSASHNQKRVINQSVGQLTNVKHINSAQLANVPGSSGHKKVQSLLNNLQQRDQSATTSNGRQIHLIQPPGVSNTQPGGQNTGSLLNAGGLAGSQSSSTRHRKPPMLVRTNNTQRMGGVSQIPGTQPHSTQNRNRGRDQWINFANIMQPGAQGQQEIGQNQLTPMGSMAQNKLSSDFIVKNGAANQPAANSPAGSKQSFLGLMQTQPVAGSIANKAKFKQTKPLSNNRGKSVPQERPSNTQGNGGAGGGSLASQTAQGAGVAYGSPQGHGAGNASVTKSSTGIRISSQRQQFISSSNKTIKTLKQFNQGGGRQQPHTADNPQK